MDRKNKTDMKTAEEYLDEAIEAQTPSKHRMISDGDVYHAALKAMQAYAKAAIEEQLKVAAEEAGTKDDYVWHGEENKHVFASVIVDQDSILNCTRIDLR